MRLDEAEALAVDEYWMATGKFGAFNSAHEGYAVILEEMDELWETVKQNQPLERMVAEAIQVAAMALRFVVDMTTAEPEVPHG